MRLYIYISDLGAGGAERVCVNLANELTNLSHEVHTTIQDSVEKYYRFLT